VLGAAAWWWAGYAVAVLPRSLVVLARAGAPAAVAALRRAARRADPVEVPVTRARALTLGLLGVPIGLWAWVAALLLVPNTLRNLAYPVSNPTPADYATAWGGPTLAGAWAVHAALALALVPVWLAVLRGLGALHVRLVDRAGAAAPTPWEPLVVAALAVALVVLGRAWWHQV
jgi:hypothetical protein